MRRIPLLAAALCAVGLAATAEARDLRVPEDFATLEDALDDAVDGDVILLAEGSHAGNVVVDLEVTIEGAGRDLTFVEGDRQGSVIRINDHAVLRGLTVLDGDATYDDGNGGCVSVAGANATIEDVAMRDCTAFRGGCLALVGGAGTVSGVALSNCSAVATAELETEEDRGHGAGIWAQDSSAVITGVRAWGNTANGYGGGVALRNGAVHLRDSYLYDNLSEWGGGVVMWGGSPVLERVTAARNTVELGGGGFSVYRAVDARLLQCASLENRVTFETEFGGAGVWLIDGSLTLEASQVAHNDSELSAGGGLHVSNGGTLLMSRVVVEDNETDFASAGLYANTEAVVVDVSRSRFTANDAGVAGGGARLEARTSTVRGVAFDDNESGGNAGALSVFAADGAGEVRVENNLFFGNSAVRGSGLLVQGSPVSVLSNTFHSSLSSETEAGAVRLHGDFPLSVDFHNNVVAATQARYDVYAPAPDEELIFFPRYNLLGTADGGEYGGNVASSLGEGDTFADADFVSESLGGVWGEFLRLEAGAGIDDGDPAEGQDYEDGSATDRGAFGGQGAEIWTDGDSDEDGFTVWEDDCDDYDAAVHPGAGELCNCRDDDCDGLVDEELGVDVCDNTAPCPADGAAGAVPFTPAAGCLLRCDAGASSSAGAGLALVVLTGRRRRHHASSRS